MPGPSETTPQGRGRVLAAGALLVGLYVGFRAWAMAGGWFYGDDFRLVREASRSGLSLEALTAPYDAQFMPGGRALAALGAVPDQLSWPVLATIGALLQALAGAACLWMLVVLFGRRWRILAPLALYLASAITMPASLWWAASLNQVPLQVAFFAAVALWVTYLRSRRLRWLAATLLVVALGLCFYVKTLLVLPVLAFLALGWFASGGPVRRTATALRRYWPAALAGAAGGVAFLAYYVLTVPQITSTEPPRGAARLAERMLGESFVTAAVGGPWRWDEQIAPAAQADPPAWTVHLSWTVVALVVAYLALRRERTLRAWGLLAGYLLLDYALLLTTRAQAVGSVAGTEYRYLTDAACALALATGLALMEVRGAEQSSRLRAEPVLTRGLGRRTAGLVLAALVVSSAWSSWSYARVWHTNHPGRELLSRTLASVEGVPEVALANQFLPVEVIGVFQPPYNESRVILPLLTTAPVFPDETSELHVVDEEGEVVPADLDEATSAPSGPTEGCGWRVGASPRTIPLRGPAIDVSWWVRIDYLVSSDTGVRVVAGASDRRINLPADSGTRFFELEGPFSSLRLGELDPGVTLCVDDVTVGQPEPADRVAEQEDRADAESSEVRRARG